MKKSIHKELMRELYYSLSARGKSQLIDAMMAQLSPDQQKAVQAQQQRAPGPSAQGVRS